MRILLLDGQERLAREQYIQRDLSLDYEFLRKTDKITAITGARRVGKSVFLRQILSETGTPPEKAVTIDFSGLPWIEFTALDWEVLWRAVLELGCGPEPLCLFDEIQSAGDFAPGLRYLQNQGARIFVTGSCQDVFERHLAASLRGKVLPYILYPLSFSEFLRFKRFEPGQSGSTAVLAARRALLDEYLEWGGFPEVVLADRPGLKRNLIDSYWDVMLFRDIVEQYGVKNVPVLERLVAKILLSFAREFSVHRWYNDLRSQGYRVGKDTVYEYLGYFENAMFVHVAGNAAAPGGARKIYLVDNGLYQKIKDRPDTGKLWENLCFMDFLRRGIKPGYWKDARGEVDFIAPGELVQATVSLTEDNRRREEGPLESVGALHPGHSRRILTLDLY